jgi:mannose-6-phosphate isomerase
MAIEHASVRALPKPWGVVDLSPWSRAGHDGLDVGEIWFERPGNAAIEPSLLLKLLFTSQPLSIQVHPDDAAAHAMGLPRGKTEAWYVLSATAEAKIALGLKRRLTAQQLREAIEDGSISDLIVWRKASAGDVIFVPAGTVHAIGAGLVIAEIQQRSDVTFRLFDYGRDRELHMENAIVVADAGPADLRVPTRQLTAQRKLLVSSPHFEFEQIDLAPNSSWCLDAERETWLLVIGGAAIAGSFEVATGDVLFAQSDRVDIHLGAVGMVGLVAYTGGSPVTHLLQPLTRHSSIDFRRLEEIQLSTSLTHIEAASRVAAWKQ